MDDVEHKPDECTYIDPNNEEVLAFRDERHVVLDAEEYRTLVGLAAKQNTLNERLCDENQRLSENNYRLYSAIQQHRQDYADAIGPDVTTRDEMNRRKRDAARRLWEAIGESGHAPIAPGR